MSRLLSCGLFAVCMLVGARTLAAPAEREPENAARAFGAALARGEASEIRSFLPAAGKVRLALRVLGPEDGLFGTGQAEAIFRDLLAKTAVRSCEVLRVESDGRTGGLAVLRLAVTDSEGHARRIGLRLTLEPERGRWVVREVRETPE